MVSTLSLVSLCGLASALVVPSEPLDLLSLDKRANDGIIANDVNIQGFTYYMNVKVGSEGEVFNPVCDTGSPITWFPDNDGWVYQSKTLVNTSEPFHVQYISSFSNTGYFVKDTLAFTQGSTDEDFKFGVIDNVKGVDGIVGLSQWNAPFAYYIPEWAKKYVSLPNYLKESGAIDHTIVNFYYSTKQGQGKVIFGGYDQSKVGSEWSVHSDPDTFKVPVTNVTTNGVTHYPDFGDYPIVVDTGAGYCRLPQAIMEPIAAMYTNVRRNGPAFEVDCDVPDKSFQLGFGDLILDIPSRDFLVPHDANAKTCEIGAIVAEKAGNGTLIGGAILNHVISIFDHDNKLVKVANYKETEEEDIVKPE